MADNEKVPHLVLRSITVVAIVGAVFLLISRKDSGSAIIYDLFVYGISISALTLTTLQSISIAQQVRITRRSTGRLTEAVNKLDDLANEERKLAKAVLHDEEIEKHLIRALGQNKIGKNVKERTKIARAVRRSLQG